MALKNTAKNYGSVAKLLHWTIAALFLASYVTVYYRHWFTEDKTPENWIALQLHLSVGVSIAAFVFLRIFWRVLNQLPENEPGSPFAHKAAHYGHYMLYAVMILMPLTGYLGTGVDTEFFLLFDIPKFESTGIYQLVVTNMLGLTFEQFEAPIDFFHKTIMGEYVVWMLILGHASAAIFHHLVLKDRTLEKMTSGKG